jgi:DNA ligase-1
VTKPVKASEDEAVEEWLQNSYDKNQEAQIDHSRPWSYAPLFKTNKRGKTLIWKIGFNPDTSEMLMNYGQVGGLMRTDRTVVVPKAKRDMIQQSLQQVNRKYTNKFDKGYRAKGEAPAEIGEPMLFETWKPEVTELNYDVGTQPKLDGVRCLARLDDTDEVIMRSRSSKIWKPELAQFYAPAIKELLHLLPEGAELDGEMWGPGLSFQDITSLCKNLAKLSEDHDKIAYRIFTMNVPDTPAEDRYAELKKAFRAYRRAGGDTTKLKLVKMHTASSAEEIISQHREYLLKGYEGTVIYRYGNDSDDPKILAQSYYKPGRVNNVLKYKATADGEDTFEEEGEIVGYDQAGGNQEGAIIFKVKDPRGHTFRVGLIGSIEHRRELFDRGDTLIGKKITYGYQNLTDGGVPRFPVGKAIRDYE